MGTDIGHFNVDITVNGKDGVATIALVKQYLKAMPALQTLVLVVKALLEQHGLHSAQTSGLSSYCVICMVISFLQVRLASFSAFTSTTGRLISVAICYAQVNPKERPQDWIDDPIASKSFGWLLLDFLEYYGAEPPVPERPTVARTKIEEPSTSDKLSESYSEPSASPQHSTSSMSSDDMDEVEQNQKAKPKEESSATEDEAVFHPSKGFPYMTHYISVRKGTLLLKEDKGWLRENAWENGTLSIECLVNQSA